MASYSHFKCRLGALRHASNYSSSYRSKQRRLALDSPYRKTIQNLQINSDTKVIIQGFTGKQATFDAKQSIEYGTKIVGGVRPGKDGEHLGLPVLPSVRAAMEQLKPDATAVYVAASQAASAIEEAIEAEVPLIVAVAEFIPLHDMLRIQSILHTQDKSRLVGANCPGMINPHARCRIGFPPIPFFMPGSIGIASKSGTLSYETVASTTRAGLGQSLVVGIGGDPLPGTDFVDVLEVLRLEENTEGIIIVGEIGGNAEHEVARWVRKYRKHTEHPKPIMALVGGLQAVPGVVMGHAGASVQYHNEDALSKIKALESAGVAVTDHPSKFGNLMKGLLEKNSYTDKSLVNNSFGKGKRAFHTLRRTYHPAFEFAFASCVSRQQRDYHVLSTNARRLLEEYGFPLSPKPPDSKVPIAVVFSVNRGIDTTCIKVKTMTYKMRGLPMHLPRRLSSEYPYTASSTEIEQIVSKRLLDAIKYQEGPDSHKYDSFAKTVSQLALFYRDHEVSKLAVYFDISEHNESTLFQVVNALLEIDDSAYRSSGRQNESYELRDAPETSFAAIEAEKYGIVYIPLPGEGNIGTLVNGAGLAMNTTDALCALGGRPSNFLDTGGKATSETVSQSFRTILTNKNVTAIFVNIFGGLTLCDMIAQGILMAYKDVGIKVPVVVRLRGTNEKEGQKLIGDSGLPIEAFDDFEEAAKRVIELANTIKEA